MFSLGYAVIISVMEIVKANDKDIRKIELNHFMERFKSINIAGLTDFKKQTA